MHLWLFTYELPGEKKEREAERRRTGG